MANNWLLKKNHLPQHRTRPRLYSDILKGSLGRDVRDEYPCRGYRNCTAGQRKKMLPLLAAFAAVSVIVLLAYLCSLSIRMRVPKLSFGRKLSTRSDEEKDVPAFCVTDTDEDPRASQDSHSHPTPSSRASPTKLVQDESETTAHMPPPRTAMISSRGVWPPAVPQLSTAGYQMTVKRKERENSSRERETKLIRLEAPIQETPPGRPPPHLDPFIDPLVDYMLPGIEDAFSDGSWLLDSEPYYTAFSALQTDRPAPMEEPVGQQSLHHPAQTDHIPPGSSGDAAAVDESSLTDTTPLSFFESVLSESSHMYQAALDEWLLSKDAKDLGEALGLMASTEESSPLRRTSEFHKEAQTSQAALAATASEGRMDSGAQSSTETSQGGSLSKRTASVSFHLLATGYSGAREQEIAARTQEQLVVRGFSPPTSDSAALTSPKTLAGTSLQADEPASQLVRARAQSATVELLGSFRWIGGMFETVGGEVLASHPFYRHPQSRESLSGRAFKEANAASSRICHRKAVSLLSECRRLLKKSWLTDDELEELLSYTEGLCGYACTSMPAHSRVTTTALAVETLGRVFLILDTLHSAAQTLGDASRKEQWWPVIVRHIENARYRGGTTGAFMRRTCWSGPMLTALNAAIDYYRVGQRPPPRLVIGIKLAIFLSPLSTRFRKAKWDPWRRDAEEWLQSTKLTAEACNQSTKESTG